MLVKVSELWITGGGKEEEKAVGNTANIWKKCFVILANRRIQITYIPINFSMCKTYDVIKGEQDRWPSLEPCIEPTEDWNRVIKHYALHRKLIYIHLKQSSELPLKKNKKLKTPKPPKQPHVAVKYPNLQVSAGETEHPRWTFSTILLLGAFPQTFQTATYLL